MCRTSGFWARPLYRLQSTHTTARAKPSYAELTQSTPRAGRSLTPGGHDASSTVGPTHRRACGFTHACFRHFRNGRGLRYRSPCGPDGDGLALLLKIRVIIRHVTTLPELTLLAIHEAVRQISMIARRWRVWSCVAASLAEVRGASVLEEPASPPPASWALMSVSSGRALLLFSDKGGEKGAEKGTEKGAEKEAEKGAEKARSTQRKRTDRRRRFLQPLQHASLRVA